MITQKNYRCTNLIESAEVATKVFLSEAYQKASAVLVQIYAQCWRKELIYPVLIQWKQHAPKAEIVGMTAMNEEMFSFDQDKIYEKIKDAVFVFNVIFFEESSLEIHAFDCSTQTPYMAGGYMGQILSEETDAKGVLLYTAKPYIEVEDYLMMACATNENVPFFGANGSIYVGNIKDERTHLKKAQDFLDRAFSILSEDVEKESATNYIFYFKDGKPKILNNGFVNVVFCGNNLHVRTGYNFGWTPIGKRLRIDKVDGSRLVEQIEGLPASYMYKKYLGLRPDQIRVENVAEFPFTIHVGERDYAKQGYKVEGNPDGLLFSSPVSEGDLLRLSYGNPDTIFAESSIEAEASLIVPAAFR